MNEKFLVYVSTPLDLDWRNLDVAIRHLAKKHNGRETGSGAGFGRRDLDFEFPNKDDAQKFEAAVNKENDAVKVSYSWR